MMFRRGTRADSAFFMVDCSDLEDEFSASERFSEGLEVVPVGFIVLVMLESVFLSKLTDCCCRPMLLPIIGMLELFCSCIFPAGRNADGCYAEHSRDKNYNTL